jgi:carboxyl-terminal processing protease
MQKKAISFIAIIFLSSLAQAKIDLSLSDEKANLGEEIFLKISNEHFFLNKDLAMINVEIFHSLIAQLDSQKIYFTKYEINSFSKKFKDFDNVDRVNKKNRTETKKLNLEATYLLINLYFNRLIEATNFQLAEVDKQKFNFLDEQEILITDENKEWQKSKYALKKTWSKLAKNDVLTSMLADKDLQEATDTIIKRYKNRLRRISQRNEEDVFSIAMNNLTSIFDPHSSYFSPKSAEDFEMTMSLKLEGIGALLTTEDDYPLIVSVVPGGPAEKTGKINPDDKIVKIAQMINPNEPAVDVVGWRIDEVVQLIRGKAGTKVELELIPAKTEDLSERKFVTITREEVKLEEQAAKSRIVEIEHNLKKSKIGIIDLPAFYIDFNAWRSRDPNFRSSSKDVEKILDEFNSLDVDGVIVDLRGNSGGSLFEANKLIGLFIASGATLQVKENTGDIRTWGDAKAMQVWSKPMAVMVDRYSASASEIFAGAIQDYQRGLIIGHRTFGKGTVQKLDSLTSGQLKVTESKFYRITGSGMQNKGIIPDIALPATWDIEEFGESSLDAALPWDQIRPLRFKKFSMNPSILLKLKNTHSDRLMNNPDLQYILDIRERYDLQKDKETISLNINKRTLQKKDRQQWALKTENKRRAKLNLQIFETYDAMEEFNESKEDLEIDIDIDIENDYLLKEGAKILSDYLHLYENILVSKAA